MPSRVEWIGLERESQPVGRSVGKPRVIDSMAKEIKYFNNQEQKTETEKFGLLVEALWRSAS